MCLADRLEGVDTVCVLLAHLHDLAETALAYHLEQLKVLNLELACAVLHVLDTNLELSGAVLHIYPLNAGVAKSTLAGGKVGGGLLAVLLARLGVLGKGVLLLEAGVDANDAEEDVLTTTGSGGSHRVAHVQMNDELGHTGHIELVLGVSSSPQGALRRALDRVDEDLHFIEIQQGIRHVLAGNSAMVGGDAVEATARCLWAAGAVDEGAGDSLGGRRADGASDAEGTAGGYGALV